MTDALFKANQECEEQGTREAWIKREKLYRRLKYRIEGSCTFLVKNSREHALAENIIMDGDYIVLMPYDNRFKAHTPSP